MAEPTDFAKNVRMVQVRDKYCARVNMLLRRDEEGPAVCLQRNVDEFIHEYEIPVIGLLAPSLEYADDGLTPEIRQSILDNAREHYLNGVGFSLIVI